MSNIEQTETSNTAQAQIIDLDQIRAKQNLVFGIIAGLVVAIIGACLWALISVTTGYQIGYMAVAVGLMVGFTVRFTGKGIDQVFGIVGGACALIGCLLGNYLTILGFLAEYENNSILNLLTSTDIPTAVNYMKEYFQAMDLLFYAIALYEGYQFSFISLENEIEDMQE